MADIQRGEVQTNSVETNSVAVEAASRAAESGQAGDDVATRIAGLSVLKGLVVYGATLTFAALYGYFMAKIAAAANNTPPNLSNAMVAAAAALAGVLGSAFALVVGVPTDATNEDLSKALADQTDPKKQRLLFLRKILSLEPGGRKLPSGPLTFGIWAYAIVAGAVAIVYILNQGETPEAIKALAIAFAGYVIAFMTAAYGIASKRST
jgi:hypothetical protein